MATRTVEVATNVPGLSAERAVTWPKQTRARFSNGLEVILAEAHSIPKFHGELFFRSGNAAALDLTVGNKPIGPMGSWGEVRMIRATPTGYEFVSAAPSSSCNVR